MKTNALGILFAVSAFFVATLIAVVGQAAPLDHVPEHARACCVVSGCSGVVVSRGPKWSRLLLARHCFGGAKLGDKFQVAFIDGSTSTATLLTTHQELDLALMAVQSDRVLGIARVADGRPDAARYEAVGWPVRCVGNTCRQQLTYFSLHPAKQPIVSIEGQADQFRTQGGLALRWAFEVVQGGNTPGASGMPIFANGQVIGINSNNDSHESGRRSYCSTPEQTAEFLRIADTKGCAAWKMGDWSAPAINLADAPAPLSYGSNHPLKFAAPRFYLAQAPQVGNAPPPPAQDAAQHGSGETGPPSGTGGTDGREASGDVYSGKGKPPKDLRGPHKKAKAIDETRHREAELEHEVAQLRSELEQTKALARQPGPPGRDGQDFTPPAKPVVILPSPKPKHGPLHALLIGGLVFAGVVVVSHVHTIRKSSQ